MTGNKRSNRRGAIDYIAALINVTYNFSCTNSTHTTWKFIKFKTFPLPYWDKLMKILQVDSVVQSLAITIVDLFSVLTATAISGELRTRAGWILPNGVMSQQINKV